MDLARSSQSYSVYQSLKTKDTGNHIHCEDEFKCTHQKKSVEFLETQKCVLCFHYCKGHTLFGYQDTDG